MENPTSHDIARSLNIDEKLHPVSSESGEEIQLQPIRRLSADQVREKTERKGSMPKGRRASRANAGDEKRDRRGDKATSKT